MSDETASSKIEFGDFQTPVGLALDLCEHLGTLGIAPDIVIEPTCGVGAFLIAAARVFPEASRILGFEVNQDHLDRLRDSLSHEQNTTQIDLEQADFFATDWRAKIDRLPGSLLILGNFPWVTNAAQSVIGGINLPEKSNFLRRNGFDAMSGKANFDISEWMLLDVLSWLHGRSGDVAMLVKTSVARKVLAHTERLGMLVYDTRMIRIDAKKHFGVAVDACLLVIRLSDDPSRSSHDYTVFSSLSATVGHRVGHREGLTISDLDTFAKYSYLLGNSPQKWRSGVKHDASSVMEFTRSEQGLENGLGEVVELEPTYVFPMLKGSDIGSDKGWRHRYMMVTQHYVGESTSLIHANAPLTWAYLQRHACRLDMRASRIYVKNPLFSVFGVGDYTFRPWKIAICALYKKLRFRLVGPIEGRPVIFDDTVYYVSFDAEAEARDTLDRLNSKPASGLLSSLIFWDEKRPIKTGILNAFDWTHLDSSRVNSANRQLGLNFAAPHSDQ